MTFSPHRDLAKICISKMVCWICINLIVELLLCPVDKAIVKLSGVYVIPVWVLFKYETHSHRSSHCGMKVR